MPNKPAAKPSSPNQPAQKPAPPKSTASDEKRTFEPKYNWMNKTRQWGVRVKPGKAGLRLGDLNVGIYGETPTQWADQSRNPRGAVPRRGMPPVGYSIRDKAGLWADCAADLYEEAIQRRWAPATDVPWDTIEPLPDDVEHAVCQVCTELVGYANVDIETITGWQHQMSYGYHEVKQFLATASFDAARHYECFRKRALANGGGLGLEGPGMVNRMILESRGGWTEAVVYLLIMRGTFAMTLYKYLGRHAHNDAERFIYGHALADKARHVTYALDHLKYAMAHADDVLQVVRTLIAIGEGGLTRDLRDPVLAEALAVVFGRGVAKAAGRGMAVYGDMMRDYVATYLGYCQWLGVPRDPARLPPPLNEYANPTGAEA
ncbi:MAG: hypothetical protein OXI79_08265 [Gammaproteobacteria bacterium]|nr:hypothetical protein [Gammaproteobacteria bacterium]